MVLLGSLNFKAWCQFKRWFISIYGLPVYSPLGSKHASAVSQQKKIYRSF